MVLSMRSSLLVLVFLIVISACTKEVPEAEKRPAKTADETAVRQVIENFVAAYNAGDLEAAVSLFDDAYLGILPDSVNIMGKSEVRNDLLQYLKQYPDGKWEMKIEEVNVSDGYAFAICNGSFLMPDPLEGKMNPIYSERSIRILKKDKYEGWKIYRFLGAPTFSYDNK